MRAIRPSPNAGVRRTPSLPKVFSLSATKAFPAALASRSASAQISQVSATFRIPAGFSARIESIAWCSGRVLAFQSNSVKPRAAFVSTSFGLMARARSKTTTFIGVAPEITIAERNLLKRVEIARVQLKRAFETVQSLFVFTLATRDVASQFED